MKKKANTSASTHTHEFGFTLEDFRQFCIRDEEWCSKYSDMYEALRLKADLTYTKATHGLILSACYHGTGKSINAYGKKIAGTHVFPRAPLNIRNSINTCVISNVYGCSYCSRCSLGSRGWCDRSGLDVGRIAGVDPKSMIGQSIERYHTMSATQYMAERLNYRYAKGAIVLENDNAELMVESTPQWWFDAIIGHARLNPHLIKIISTHNPMGWLRFMENSIHRNAFKAGLIQNVIFMHSICTQAEADRSHEALTLLGKDYQLNLQLSCRPLIERVVLHPGQLTDARITAYVGSGFNDWKGNISDSTAALFLEYANDLRKQVEGAGRVYILVNTGKVVPTQKIKICGREVFLEVGVPRTALELARKQDRLILARGAMPLAKRGSDIGAVELNGVHYVNIGRQYTGKFTGPMVADNKAFIAAQLQAPVSG